MFVDLCWKNILQKEIRLIIVRFFRNNRNSPQTRKEGSRTSFCWSLYKRTDLFFFFQNEKKNTVCLQSCFFNKIIIDFINNYQTKFCQTSHETIGILQQTRIIFLRQNVNWYVYFEAYCVGYVYTSTTLRLADFCWDDQLPFGKNAKHLGFANMGKNVGFSKTVTYSPSFQKKTIQTVFDLGEHVVNSSLIPGTFFDTILLCINNRSQ